jgi:4-alpha-glucanotransferase
VNEHPNWRQRLPVSVNDIANEIDIEALKNATQERASGHHVGRARVSR